MAATTPNTIDAPATSAQIAEEPPLAYFDGVTNMAFGPFVTRVTLGVQQNVGGGAGKKPENRPTMTVVMPTASSHHLAREISKTLDNPEHQKILEHAFATYQKSFPGSRTDIVDTGAK
ncbi:hypothetical protein [Paraburkholderia phosphatilytica]|uniref:hypothetical protein n=1 Tax=Paraburkholderia phosphatilytica TaxID=2282883 RepID=UPI000E4F1E41|nr:hypothetical protein [Paraburkholderia phosphatilytica]